MAADTFLTRWITVLYVTAAIAGLFDIIAPLSDLLDPDFKLVLTHGIDKQTIMGRDLPTYDLLAISAFVLVSHIVWLMAIVEAVRLARHFQCGHIFEERCARCLIRIGYIVVAFGFVDSFTAPVFQHFLYWRGISPWLMDAPLIYTLQPDAVMAGLFLIILGSVMRRAAALEENNRLIV
jgi:hypothetical protein